MLVSIKIRYILFQERMSSAVKPETLRGKETTTASSRTPWIKTG